MTRKFTEKNLIIASHNTGKIREIAELLSPFGINIHTGAKFNLKEPEETGSTFAENALIKSTYFVDKTGLPSLADDSGIIVELLNGNPGIYSARWGGEKKDFNIAMKKVAEEVAKTQGITLDGIAKLKPEASFICTLSLTWSDGHTEQFEGRVTGTLTWPPRGNSGFGYDAIFIPTLYNKTFAEMDSGQKQLVSHRARAFAKLIEGCF